MRLLSLAFIAAGLSACSLAMDVQDISEVELSFASPPENIYYNQTSFDFAVQLHSDNPRLSLKKAKLHVFENPICDPDKLVDTRSLNPDSNEASSNVLENGKKYSARVSLEHEGRQFQSVCSPWVGIDTDSPVSVAVQHPSTDNYVTSKELMAAWSPSHDLGISGLRDKPYHLQLYGQPSCAGEVLQQADSPVEQYIFENLTHGVTYSVQVSAVDKAGNRSVVSCSPYTEIDIYAPGFTLQDPSSAAGYSRTLNPQIIFENDAQASYWCLTTDLSYRPGDLSENCPGGAGPANGWYTSRPTTLPLTSADGLKTFNLWAYRGNGTLLSQNVTSVAIHLDRTLPGNFTVTGVVAENEDLVIDEWLTSNDTPIIHWSTSTDATDYSVQILNAALQVVCEKENIPPATSFHFTECTDLEDQETYTIHLKSFDVARNVTQAPSFNFTVDRIPPQPFTISGISGGSDVDVDTFFGVGLPTVHFTPSSGATHYEVEIKDAADVTACTLGTVAVPATALNYASHGGVTCVLVDGTYKAYVTAYDDGRNKTAAANDGFNFIIDTQAPSLSITSTPIVLTQNTAATFSFETADAVSGVKTVQCSLDGGPYAPCEGTQNYSSLAEGPHQFRVRSVDTAGNEIIRSESWVIDLTNPVLTILSAPPTVGNNPNIAVIFSASDSSGIAEYQCSLNGATFTSCTSPQNFVVAQGSYTFTVRALDPLGWYDEKSASFIVDLTDPTVAITSRPAAITSSKNPSFVFSGADTGGASLARFECSWDGAAFATCTSPASRTGVAEGSHNFKVRSVDTAGNISAEESYSWIVHSTGPVLSWTSVPASPTPSTSASASFSGTTIAGLTITGYECSLNGGTSYVACSSPYNMTGLTAASYTLLVRGIDSLGVRGTPISTTWLREVVVTISSNTTNVNIQSLFAADLWSSSAPKRVVINSGVTVGGTSPSTPAMRTGSGWGGTLTVQNYGSILGAGGAANSGTGGTAFLADAGPVYLTNTGAIRGGGGGGGRGGNGGAGYYQTYTDEGPYYNGGPAGLISKWEANTSNTVSLGRTFWQGAEIAGAIPFGVTQVTIGGHTYVRGAQVHQNSQYYFYQIIRRVYTNHPTSGGTGGNGGRGTGYEGAAVGGSAGSGGGTNAGHGGSGGAGGGWGAAGVAGSAGGNGNSAGGAAGAAGGLAGFGIQNAGNVSLSNSGSILGR